MVRFRGHHAPPACDRINGGIAKDPKPRTEGETAKDPKPRTEGETAKDPTPRHVQLQRLLDKDTSDVTELDAGNATDGEADETLVRARSNAGSSSKEPLEVLRAWWWESVEKVDTPDIYWPSSTIFGDLSDKDAHLLETRADARLKTNWRRALKYLAKAMRWKQYPALQMYVLFGKEMCGSRKFMDGVRKLVTLAGSRRKALRALKDAQRLRRSGQVSHQKVSSSSEWSAYDTDVAETALQKKADQGRDRDGLHSNSQDDEESDIEEDDSQAGEDEDGDEIRDEDRGGGDGLHEVKKSHRAGLQQPVQSKNRSQLLAGQHSEPMRLSRSKSPLTYRKRRTWLDRESHSQDDDFHASSAGSQDEVPDDVPERSPEVGRGYNGDSYDDARSETSYSDSPFMPLDDDSRLSDRAPDPIWTGTVRRDAGRNFTMSQSSARASLPPIGTPRIAAPKPHHPIAHSDMHKRLKRELPSEASDDECLTKRRHMLSILGRSETLTPSIDPQHEDALETWLRAVCGGGGSEEDGLQVTHRRVDDTNPLPQGDRTCVLYTDEGGKSVACAYIENRSGMPACKMYVADKTAIHVDAIKRHLRREHEDCDPIQELDFTLAATDSTYYPLVVVATFLCLNLPLPLPNGVMAHPPIWSHAMTTLLSGSNAKEDRTDTRAALATVDDLLFSTTTLISKIPEPNKIKQSGRLTTMGMGHLSHSHRQRVLYCDALETWTTLATGLLADATLIGSLVSMALDRLGCPKDRPEDDVHIQQAIESCEASLAAQRNLTSTQFTRSEVVRLEKQLEDLRRNRTEPQNDRLELVQQHMRYLAGFIATRRTEYEMDRRLLVESA
ncbi:hypothetical protein TI39_contig4383g00001 [Zymoseptoria brevis]|uniref:Uncharacterized protein n=1 Tax=Zymoseptoria brevis TaxID=1047168 RepID=A0A0F4GAB4_9PEZI|nr:hypothetical protein TI39_contig4383g00001 [Zymoseptoria brevis]